jgi:hypothetical protein
MAHLRLWLCVILMFLLHATSESRLVNQDIVTSNPTKPVAMGAKELFQIVSTLKGTKTRRSTRWPHRRSPGSETSFIISRKSFLQEVILDDHGRYYISFFHQRYYSRHRLKYLMNKILALPRL